MIPISVMSNKLQYPIERDSMGVKIEPGLRVAYNRSGNVVLGEILEITKNFWVSTLREGWQYLKFEMKIKNVVDGEISTIKNPNSFIIC